MQLQLQKYNLIGPETWCDKKLDSCHKALTVGNLLVVNVYVEAVCAV